MEPSESPPAAEPRWVMMLMDNHGCSEDHNDGAVIANAKTAAADSCTSAGRHFRLSFGIAAPPAFSFIHSDMVWRRRACNK
ncbi:unnamed protein product [Urochloa humidicola]